MMQYAPAVVVALLLLQSCADADERYDVGYGDGYATGYNTTCDIRVTLIEGDFNDSDYQRGYVEGYGAGAEACHVERAANRD